MYTPLRRINRLCSHLEAKTSPSTSNVSGKLDWKGDVAVVTGGGAGIGQATTFRLAMRGLTVVIMDFNPKAIAATKKIAAEKGLPGTIIGVQADIRDPKGREAVAAAVKATGKPLRVLIHNAGVNTPCKMMMELTDKEWGRVMDINMNGPLYLTQV